MIPAGLLRHLVTFQENQPIKGSSGEAVDNYVDVFCRYAYFRSFGAKALETWTGLEFEAQYVGRLTVRYDHKTKNLSPGRHRMTFDGNVYELEPSVDSVFRDNDIEFLVRRVNA